MWARGAEGFVGVRRDKLHTSTVEDAQSCQAPPRDVLVAPHLLWGKEVLQEPGPPPHQSSERLSAFSFSCFTGTDFAPQE